jgi:CO/xanthine dehydrogenase Mo-binding subunit
MNKGCFPKSLRLLYCLALTTAALFAGCGASDAAPGTGATVVNPSTMAVQMEGGIVFRLSAALWGEITLAEGRVQQSNFHDCRVMRMHEAPRIEVHIVPSTEAPGGVGEPGTSAAIPALVNAVFAASGRRIRSLPVGTQLSKTASGAVPAFATNDKA